MGAAGYDCDRVDHPAADFDWPDRWWVAGTDGKSPRESSRYERVRELVGGRGPAAGLGNGELSGVAGQGRVRDVVVQAARELKAAQGLQQVPAGFGQDVAAGEGAAHGEDDRGDVNGGERGVHPRAHPVPDRLPGRAAPLQ